MMQPNILGDYSGPSAYYRLRQTLNYISIASEKNGISRGNAFPMPVSQSNVELSKYAGPRQYFIASRMFRMRKTVGKTKAPIQNRNFTRGDKVRGK